MMKNDILNFNKKILFFLLFLSFYTVFSKKTAVFFSFFEKKLENRAFEEGEVLKYKISYGRQNKKRGLISAGNATLKVEKTINNNYLFKAFGQTTRIFSLFMKVKHEYQSIVNPKTLNAVEFTMKIEEGKYFNTDSIVFGSKLNIETQANDIVSTFYKLRAISKQNVLSSDTVFFSYYYNSDTIQSYIINLGEEIINTRFGEIKTIKWSPLLEKGRMFNDTTGAFVWTTVSPMHIPVKIEFPILVGSIYVNLISAKETLYNLTE